MRIPDAYLVTDIDGTLGGTVEAIAESLSQLRRLAPRMGICLVTGRTLTSVAPLRPFIPAGTLLSPWGGGNVLRLVRSSYEPVVPMTAVRRPLTLSEFNLTFVPNRALFDESMEVTMAPEARWEVLSHLCVGGYRAALNSPRATRGVRHRGLDGAQWDIVSPWRRPRERLLRKLATCGVSWIAYWGDDDVDKQALGLAAVVLAPKGTALAACSDVLTYRSVQQALEVTMQEFERAERKSRGDT